MALLASYSSGKAWRTPIRKHICSTGMLKVDMTWILLCIPYPKYVASGEEILRARGTMRTYALTPAQKEAITGFRCLACHGSTAFPAFQRSLWLDQSDAFSEASCAPACLTWRNGRSRRTAPPSASVNSGWMKFMKHIEASWLMNLGKTMESNAKHMKASSRCRCTGLFCLKSA